MSLENKDQIINYIFSKLSETPELVNKSLNLDGKNLKFRWSYYRIKSHIDRFIKKQSENRLILLTGFRGVGKTTILFQIYDYLVNQRKINNERVFYFSVDEVKAYLGVKIIDIIYTFIREINKTTPIYLDKEIFILIDEAHFDPSWFEAAKIFFDKNKNIFMIFTGSSALSFEINVDLVRRCLKETVFPLNFSEYIILSNNEWLPERNMTQNIRQLLIDPNEKNFNTFTETENRLLNSLIKIKKPIEIEWENFILYKNFPFTLNEEKQYAQRKIFNMIERIIEKDVFSLKSFDSSTKNTISRIIAFLALQPTGTTSDFKLSKRLGISPTMVRNILDILEKSHLIFSVKPYGGAGKIVKKAWKYYFISPSINASIRHILGYNVRKSELFGTLVENLVASYLVRMKETMNLPSGIFYDPNEEGVDFIIFGKNGQIIPIEVSYGKKEKKQIEQAIKRYNSNYGIVICDSRKVEKKGNVFYIPLLTFSFM